VEGFKRGYCLTDTVAFSAQLSQDLSSIHHVVLLLGGNSWASAKHHRTVIAVADSVFQIVGYRATAYWRRGLVKRLLRMASRIASGNSI